MVVVIILVRIFLYIYLIRALPSYNCIHFMADTTEVHGHASSFPKVQGEVDTARPFRSVKEAVAVFGKQQHFLTGNASSHKANNTKPKVDSSPRPIHSKPIHSSVSSSPNSCPSSSSETTLFVFLRKLEAEVEEIKRELIHMKERESETNKAIATLSFQLQNRSSSKLEATESSLSVDQWQEIRAANLEERFEYLPSLREALSIAEMEDQFGRRRQIKVQKKKKKPIVPLVGEIFSRKKRAANGDLTSSFYSTRSSIYSFT